MRMETRRHDDPEKIVDEMRISTGWRDIQYLNDSFLISFDLKHLSVIKGLSQGKDCFFLNFDAFKHLPICFYVTVGDNSSCHQYWTLNDRLHRGEGRPAYISYDNKSDRYIRRWFWNGLLHRENGPSKEMIRSFKVDDHIEGCEGFQRESWDIMVLEWWKEGFQCKFPVPSSAKIENGWRHRNKRTKNIDSPREDLASWGADRVEITWESKWKEDSMKDLFIPKQLEMTDVLEWYQDGEYTGRTCSVSNFEWIRHTKLMSEGLTKFNDAIRDNLIADLGLWDEPFYPSSEVEFLVLSEFERTGHDG